MLEHCRLKAKPVSGSRCAKQEASEIGTEKAEDERWTAVPTREPPGSLGGPVAAGCSTVVTYRSVTSNQSLPLRPPLTG